ncbi:MAG: MATE family efflux transporter [Lachnospiraceae bacterium]
MENKITQGVIWKQLLIFFGPILLGTLFQQLYSTVDAIIVGKYIGTQALAAVGNTSVFISLLIGFFMGLAGGAGVVISQFYGANEHKNVNLSVHTSYALAIVGSFIFMIVGIIIAPTVLQWMNTPADIYEMSLSYTRIYFLGMIPMLVYNIGSGILRAVGDSKRPLYFLIVASIANIVLDLLFVTTFHMGVNGTAIATNLSQLISAVLVTLHLMNCKNQPYRLFLKEIKLHKNLLIQITRIGVPVGLQSVLYTVSNMIIQGYINGFGTTSVAAWTAYGKVDFVFWMLISSMGVAITTFAGQNYGAGKYHRVKEGNKVALKMTAVFTILLSLGMYFFARPLLLIFSSDPEVINIGVMMIEFLAPSYITYVCIEIYSGTIRGCGTVLIPTLITGLGVCGLRVLWLFVLMPVDPKPEIVMLAYPISWILSTLLYFLYYHRGKWLSCGKKRVRLKEGCQLEK